VYVVGRAWSLKYERVHQLPAPTRAFPGSGFAMRLVVLGVAGLSCTFFFKAINAGQNLKPPYDHNFWLGGISSFVATVWATRLCWWLGHSPTPTTEHKDGYVPPAAPL
jgi:hypothetical protein